MRLAEAKKITGSLTRTTKMPGLSYSLPAWECKTGSKLRKVKGSVCASCYALKGYYTMYKSVKTAQYKRLAAIKEPLWVEAMAYQINHYRERWFRWHDAGDVQDLDHLNKIFSVCRLTKATHHWLPTREAWIKRYLKKSPDNLVIRFSPAMINQENSSWDNSSMVVTSNATCPASKQDGQCLDCRKCWNKNVRIIKYLKH